MALLWGNVISFMLLKSINIDFLNQISSSLLTLTFLIRSDISLSNSYPIVLKRLGGPYSRPNPLKIVEVQGTEPATSWLVNRHADHSANDAV